VRSTSSIQSGQRLSSDIPRGLENLDPACFRRKNRFRPVSGRPLRLAGKKLMRWVGGWALGRRRRGNPRLDFGTPAAAPPPPPPTTALLFYLASGQSAPSGPQSVPGVHLAPSDRIAAPSGSRIPLRQAPKNSTRPDPAPGPKEKTPGTSPPSHPPCARHPKGHSNRVCPNRPRPRPGRVARG